MLERRRLAAALLLLAAAALPHLLWLAPHALQHHDHAGEEWTEHGQALAHGHEHPEGVPDHEHDLVLAPPVRPDPPRDLEAPQALGVPFMAAPDARRFLLSRVLPSWERIRPPGSSPPVLQLLCILLI